MPESSNSPKLEFFLCGQVIEHALQQVGHVVRGGRVVTHSSSCPNLETFVSRADFTVFESFSTAILYQRFSLIQF